MLGFLQSLALLAALAPLTFAQGSVTTITIERTYTAYGTSSPTSPSTIHKTVILDTTTRTLTSRSTTTSPLQFTTTVSAVFVSSVNVTSTFRPTTDVFTSNATINEFKTVNTTVTSYTNKTVTSTSYLATDTTTVVPTPSGFVPVDDSANNYNYNKSSAAAPNMLFGRQAASTQAASPGANAATYASIFSIVTRYSPQTTTTVVITTTKTSTQKPTAVTVSTTSTYTNTIGVPDVHVNSTIYYTTTSTQTVNQTIVVQSERTVSTSSTSALNYTSTKTSYAACATNNLLGAQLKGSNYIAQVVDNNAASTSMSTNANSGYNCCAMCQSSGSSCDFSSYNGTTSQCMMYTAPSGATCPRAMAGYFTVGKPDSAVVVSNGPCGQLTQGKPAKQATTS